MALGTSSPFSCRRVQNHELMASIAPGPLFSAKQKFHNFIRLNCGNPWSNAIENAVRKLGEMVKSMDARGSSATYGNGD